MPIMDGLEAVSSLREDKCRTKFVFLTVHEDPDFVEAAFAAGASGYVTKFRLTTDLVAAIQEVLQGRTYVSQSNRRWSSGLGEPPETKHIKAPKVWGL